MDDVFLRYYEKELDDLRRASKRFAAEFPKVAGRLQLGDGECADPYVERLLEGVAFLTARIARKMDDGQSEFPENLLNQIAPEYNAPVASRAILHIRPEEEVVSLPSGTVFEVPTTLPGKPVCRYALRDDIVFAGVDVLNTQYDEVLSVSAARTYAGRTGVCRSVGGVKLTLRCRPAAGVRDVRFYTNMPESAAGELQHALLTRCCGVLVRCGDEEKLLPAEAVQEDLMGTAEPGLPPTAEYFLLPTQQGFITVRGLRSVLPEKGEATLIFMLHRALPDRMRLLLQESPALQTNCARVINAFERRLNRVVPSWRPAEHLVADATATADYEVLRVYDGSVYTDENEKLFDIYPFYHASDVSMPLGTERLNYFSVHREQPVSPPKSRMSPYIGSEVYLQISGPDYSAHRESMGSLALRALCSNRDLPLFLRRDAALVSDKAEARFVAGPTPPGDPLMCDAARWMGLVLARRTPTAMAAYDGDALSAIVRLLLEHQHDAANVAARRQVAGVEDVRLSSTTRAIPVHGDLCVARGWRWEILLNEKAYGDGGVFLFARSLAAYLLSLSEINSFSEVSIRTTSQLLKTWYQQAPEA